MTSKSFDQITKRAVSRMCAANAKGDWSYILRIHEKARNLRAHRSARAFLDQMRRPLPVAVAAVRLKEVA